MKAANFTEFRKKLRPYAWKGNIFWQSENKKILKNIVCCFLLASNSY